MPSQTKSPLKQPLNKNKISYLAAHALFLTYTEALLPRIAPFFRLGLGNVVILLALGLDLPSFLILILIKTLAASMMNGTLFSPFVIISIAQSFASGLAMYGLNKIRKNWLSTYGISIFGSAVSTIVQILLCSLYLKSGIFALTGPMLLFSLFSALVTATLAQTLKIPSEIPELQPYESEEAADSKIKLIVMSITVLTASISIFIISNIYILTGALCVSFIAQLLCHRKIKILPHISMWIFIILSCLFIPSGKVLFQGWKITITQGALMNGIEKSLKLSAVSALSQCMASLRPTGSSILAKTVRYFDLIKLEKKNSKVK